MLSKCGHGHMHIWTRRKKTLQEFQKLHTQVTIRQSASLLLLSQLTLLSPSVTLVSPVSIISRVFLVRDAPKYQSCIVQKEVGSKSDNEQLLRFYFPLEEWQIAMSSKHLMYLANYLGLLFHLVHL